MPDICFISTEDDLRACLPVIRELRSHLDEAACVAQIQRQWQVGYLLAAAWEEGQPRSVAGFRILEFLAWGKVLYIDDLITQAAWRGSGSGGALLDWVIAYAREQGCDAVHLDSGYHRHGAHRFYLKRGFRLDCHHFALPLSDA